MEWSGIKLVGSEYVRYNEYSDGRINCEHVRFDPATRRYHHSMLYETHVAPAETFQAADFVFIGAAELLARHLGYDYHVPF